MVQLNVRTKASGRDGGIDRLCVRWRESGSLDRGERAVEPKMDERRSGSARDGG